MAHRFEASAWEGTGEGAGTGQDRRAKLQAFRSPTEHQPTWRIAETGQFGTSSRFFVVISFAVQLRRWLADRRFAKERRLAIRCIEVYFHARRFVTGSYWALLQTKVWYRRSYDELTRIRFDLSVEEVVFDKAIRDGIITEEEAAEALRQTVGTGGIGAYTSTDGSPFEKAGVAPKIKLAATVAPLAALSIPR